MSCKNAVIQVQIQNLNGHPVKKVIILLGLWFSCSVLPAQDLRSSWIDSVFQTLTLQEKIGQLFMIPVSTYLTGDEAIALSNKVKSYNVGGLYITHGGPKGEVILL